MMRPLKTLKTIEYFEDRTKLKTENLEIKNFENL